MTPRKPSRKPMRPRLPLPRLEETKRTAITARVEPDLELAIRISDPGSNSVSRITLYEAKRLHAFLTKAIAYLAARKERK